MIAYFLLDKPGGGKRPIGLLASLVGVWERLRKPYANEWLAAHPRAYDWASKGKTSVMAVWVQMVEDESLDIDREPGEDDEAAITVMLDLIKAFEKIRMRDLVEAAIALGVPSATTPCYGLDIFDALSSGQSRFILDTGASILSRGRWKHVWYSCIKALVDGTFGRSGHEMASETVPLC